MRLNEPHLTRWDGFEQEVHVYIRFKTGNSRLIEPLSNELDEQRHCVGLQTSYLNLPLAQTCTHRPCPHPTYSVQFLRCIIPEHTSHWFKLHAEIMVKGSQIPPIVTDSGGF